ncbi:MAG: hypothetical protein CMC70_02560 [Flavobacteriaceae bacterium]|nr:hypothetical protein [Flavobacteriaceae bacterium]
MSIDGGRLNAHNQRTKDFRRRKDGKIKGSTKRRATSNEKIEFDSIDPVELEKIKNAIRKKVAKRRRIDVLLLIISGIIAVVLFFLFTEKYSS